MLWNLCPGLLHSYLSGRKKQDAALNIKGTMMQQVDTLQLPAPEISPLPALVFIG